MSDYRYESNKYGGGNDDNNGSKNENNNKRYVDDTNETTLGNISTGTTDTATGTTNDISIPIGHWRNGYCGCFDYGICHPHWFTGFFCPLIAIGQIMTRMKLDWKGTPTQTQAMSRKAFTIMLVVTCIHYGVFVIATILISANTISVVDANQLNPDEYQVPTVSPFVQFVVQVQYYLNVLYIIYVIGIVYVIRTVVRRTYAIPGSSIADCLLSCIFTGCCSVSQMLRHTTDYSIYPAHVCSVNGLPSSSSSSSFTQPRSSSQPALVSSIV